MLSINSFQILLESPPQSSKCFVRFSQKHLTTSPTKKGMQWKRSRSTDISRIPGTPPCKLPIHRRYRCLEQKSRSFLTSIPAGRTPKPFGDWSNHSLKSSSRTLQPCWKALQSYEPSCSYTVIWKEVDFLSVPITLLFNRLQTLPTLQRKLQDGIYDYPSMISTSFRDLEWNTKQLTDYGGSRLKSSKKSSWRLYSLPENWVKLTSFIERRQRKTNSSVAHVTTRSIWYQDLGLL